MWCVRLVTIARILLNKNENIEMVWINFINYLNKQNAFTIDFDNPEAIQTH